MKLRPLLFMTIAGFSTLALADSVTLKSGAKIEGKIKQIFKDKIVLSTDFSDDITIYKSKVAGFTTDKEVNIKLTDGQQLKGKVASTEQGVKVSKAESSSNASAGSVDMLWGIDEKAPDYKEPFKKEWKMTLGAGFIKKTGNVDEEIYNLDFVALLQGEDDLLKLYGRHEKTTTEGEKTTDETILGIDYEHNISDRSVWYARAEVEQDKFEDIDLRLTGAGGYGYYFIKEDHNKLRGRVGLFYRHESYESDKDNENTYGTDFGLRWDYQSENKWAWYTDLSYTPSMEKYSDFRAVHESAFTTPISNDAWSLKLGIRHEYNSEASQDTDKMDITYFTNLQLNF